MFYINFISENLAPTGLRFPVLVRGWLFTSSERASCSSRRQDFRRQLSGSWFSFVTTLYNLRRGYLSGVGHVHREVIIS
jgi:hypothetical protein